MHIIPHPQQLTQLTSTTAPLARQAKLAAQARWLDNVRHIVELWDLGHFPTPHFFLGQKCRTSWDEGLSHHLERSPFSTIQHAVRCGQACLLVALVSSIISPVTFMWGGSWVWRLIFLCPLVRGSGSALSIGS